MSVSSMWSDLRHNRAVRAVGLGLAILVGSAAAVVLVLFLITVFFQITG